jgi:metacaspase-1
MSVCRSLLAFALWAPLFLVGSTQSVAAKNLGLLIGISNYELPTITRLKAPGNDVRLVFDALRERGFAKEDIVVLADDLAPGQETPARLLRPTAANILQELDTLSAKANEGDLVVVYYSGHGTYMRQSTPKVGEYIEPTGNNQVLLAIDAQPFDVIKGEIKGGIVDKTLKRKFDILKKKTFLWLILDSCHSGGFTRDASLGVTVHFVEPQVLHLPTAAPDTIRGPERPYQNPWISQGIGNKQVAFLAAPEEYPAYEKEVGTAGRSYSLFTYSLVTTLRAENFSSYRQLARALLRVQAGLSGNVPTPVFEGDLDQQMFDGSSDGPRNWLAKVDQQSEEIQVEAGALQGIQSGTIVSFEREKTVLGYGEVESTGISTSRVKPKAFNGLAAVNPSDLAGEFTANVVKPAVSFTLKVARPPSGDNTGTGSSHVAFDAVDKLVAEPKTILPIEWVRAGDGGADLHLRVMGGVIYLVAPTGELVREGRHRTPAVPISANAEVTAHDLQENLWRVLRQQNLRRIASEMRDTGISGSVDVRLKLIRDDSEFARVAVNEKQSCKSWDKPPDSLPQDPIVSGRGPGIRLTHCDRVSIEIINKWPKPVDGTLLYRDSEGGIGVLPPDGLRIPANQAYWPQKLEPIRIITWCDPKQWTLCYGRAPREYEPTGTERLMVIIAEAEASQDIRTFDYLAQPTLDKAKETSSKPGRRGAFDRFDDLLRNAALIPKGTRGNVDRTGDVTIKLFQWEVVPPRELALPPPR